MTEKERKRREHKLNMILKNNAIEEVARAICDKVIHTIRIDDKMYKIEVKEIK